MVIYDNLSSLSLALDLDNDIVFETMADAMINEKYVGATLPSLPISSVTETQDDVRQDVERDGLQPNISKVVGFDLPPAKRRKPSNDITALSVTQGIQNSIFTKDRRSAIYTACATFDHTLEAVHDEEIKVGADIALCKHLAFLILKTQMLDAQTSVTTANAKPTHVDLSDEKNSIMEEITDTTAAMEMVLRCSAKSISTTFERISSEFLPLLFSLIREQVQEHLPNDGAQDKAASSPSVSPPPLSDEGSKTTLVEASEPSNSDVKHDAPPSNVLGDLCLKFCTKILGHFARVGSLTETLASTTDLLDTLKRVIAIPHGSIPIEAKLNCLWVLANLACSADNMVRMSHHEGLVDTLIRTASHPCEKDEPKVTDVVQYMELLKSRSIAVRAILNLSWVQENKVPFSEDTGLVDVLLLTVSHRSSSWEGRGKGVSGILLHSRRHAAGALRNIAAAPRRNKKLLCRYRSGTFLETLAEIAKNDPDSVVRDKIHATLFNLVSADTVRMFINKKDVLQVIADAATNGEYFTSGDGKDSCSMATRTLRTLEKAMPEDEDGYGILRSIIQRFEEKVNGEKSVHV